MTAVLLTGHGGFEKLEYRQDVPVPVPGTGEVLIRVRACGVNNTDINTRIGWYSKSVTTGSNDGAEQGIHGVKEKEDGSWSGIPLPFPIIQGADVCGEIVGVGAGADPGRIGERVIVATMQPGDKPWECITMGSEINGGFAQYVCVRSSVAYKITSSWSDMELASIPCAWSTAENMLHRAGVLSGQTVLITGASGGVGSAAVQLARRRGAQVLALAGKAKAEKVLAQGADQVICRGEDPVKSLGKNSVDVICDLVAGPGCPRLLDVLKPGGKYTVAGAIAGPMVELDIRTLYLKDLTFLGCTFQDPAVFQNLISYIENNEIRPIVAQTYPLKEMVRAQTDFLEKRHVGKLVLIPPGLNSH